MQISVGLGRVAYCQVCVISKSNCTAFVHILLSGVGAKYLRYEIMIKICNTLFIIISSWKRSRTLERYLYSFGYFGIALDKILIKYHFKKH